MKNKTDYVNRHIAVIILLCVALIITGVTLTVVQASSTNHEDIVAWLNKNDFSYESAEVKNQRLTVVLLSEGNDRITEEDVKAILRIHSAVYADRINGNVDAIRVVVRGKQGKVLYDYTREHALSFLGEAEKTVLRRELSSEEKTENGLKKLAEKCITTSYKAVDIQINEAVELSGKRIEMLLKPAIAEEADFSELNNELYEQLEEIALSTGAFTQCSITVVDPDGNHLIYMGGDFFYGNRIAWIGPHN